jgi:leucyl aminopeptidase
VPVESRLRTVAGPAMRAARSAGADVVAIPVRPEPGGPLVRPGESAGFDGLLPAGLPAVLAHHRVKGEPGEIVAVPLALDEGVITLLCYGVGDLAPTGLRRAGAALTRRSKGHENLVVIPPEGIAAEGLAALTEGLLLAAYAFRMTSTVPKGPPRGIDLVTDASGPAAEALDRARAVVAATALARDLTNTPSAEKSPAWLADQASALAERSGLTINVRTQDELRVEGFGGLLAVGSGATRPPRLIEIGYRPPDATGGHVVLVGKGITFDSGGLSLKPSPSMKLMKTDMAGGAAVIAVMGALAALGVRRPVTGLVAAAENMPSGSAMRPSDVIRHYGGRTSEVLNTDAEGRLVLADALAYADAHLDPALVVDIATLTGAAKVALGLRYAALYANDDALAGDLLTAGEGSGERLWRMPLTDDGRSALDSDIADLANIERGGRTGGSISAALFLREFVGDRRWAHLDIAGPARAGSDDAEITKGATGYGVRLLLRWLAGGG